MDSVFDTIRSFIRLKPVKWLMPGLIALFSLPLNPATAAGDLPRIPPVGDGEALEQWLQAIIAGMTIEEKIGQMFAPYVYGAEIRDEFADHVSRNRSYAGVDNFAEMIEKYHIGGIILAGWAGNFVSPEQTAALTNDIQKTALSLPTPIPLLLGADAEAGPPLWGAGTDFPNNMALGAAGDEELAYRAAHLIGLELKALGINQNYAPVADVNANPANPVIGLRSFGSDEDLVAALTVAQVKGYQSANVVATAKHFPGHGNTDTDSHAQLPVIHRSIEELWEVDLKPFQAAIDEGLDSIMTAHIMVPAVDASGLPATLSKPILTDLLREQMGFEGVILTDALNMAGVRAMFTDEQVAVRAVQAGVDLLLFPMHMITQYNAVLDAVKAGEIPLKRINESVYRILKLKAKRGLFEDCFADPQVAGLILGSPEHHSTAASIVEHTITLVKNEDGLLPLERLGGIKVLVTGSNVAGLVEALIAEGALPMQHQTSANPKDEAIAAAAAMAQESDLVVVLTSNANRAQSKLVNALLDTGVPVITISTSRPYDIGVYPEAGTHLAAFGARADTMQAVVSVLLGRINPSGRLPVSVPGPDGETLIPFGHGLSY